MKNRMIGIFILSNSLSGAEKRFIRISKEISLMRDDLFLLINRNLIELASFDDEISKIIQVLQKNNRIEIINDKSPFRTIRIFSILVHLLYIIKKKNIKTLHCSLGSLKFVFIKRFIKLKIIAEITSPDVAEALNEQKKFKRSVKYFNRIVVVSDTVQKKTISSLKKIGMDKFIESIVNFNIPFFLPTTTLNIKELNNKQNIIVFASRFIERKNPILFANSIHKFLNENNNWKVLILGKGPLENQIKNILKDHIETGNVTVSFAKNLYTHLSKSKIYISLIWPDNYPSQSLMEAMYCKNAILATNVGSTRKLVTEENGILIGDYQVSSVLKALKVLVSSEDRLEKMGIVSKKIIKSSFAYIEYLNKLSILYDETDF